MIETSRSPGPSRADAVWLTLLGLAGAAVFSADVTALALSSLTVGIPALLATTALRRTITDVHRRWAGRVLGTAVEAPYRRAGDTSWARRTITILRDPATWRDLLWLIVNSIVGVVTAMVSLSLLLLGVFYLIFPFLWAVTPDGVFDTNFGVFTVHDQANSFAVLPLGVLGIVLWWAWARPLLLVNARLARTLLGPRRSVPSARVWSSVA